MHHISPPPRSHHIHINTTTTLPNSQAAHHLSPINPYPPNLPTLRTQTHIPTHPHPNHLAQRSSIPQTIHPPTSLILPNHTIASPPTPTKPTRLSSNPRHSKPTITHLPKTSLDVYPNTPTPYPTHLHLHIYKPPTPAFDIKYFPYRRLILDPALRNV